MGKRLMHLQMHLGRLWSIISWLSRKMCEPWRIGILKGKHMKTKGPDRSDSLFSRNINATDREYILIRDGTKYGKQKDFIENLYSEYDPYADLNFKEEITRHFHQRLWEMYLACAFLRKKFEIVPRTQRSKAGGPDICIKDPHGNLWIEAVAPERGSGQDAVPEISSSSGSFLVPEKEIILRYRTAIKEKHEKYQKYLCKGILKDEDRYVIAINGGHVPYAFLEEEDKDEVPLPVKVVFPCGDPQTVNDNETLEIISSQYEYRPNIIKKNGEPVSTMIFLDKEYDGISALLFSVVDAVSSASVLGHDFIIIHNPVAKNRILPGYMNIGKEFWINDKGTLQSNKVMRRTRS